MSAARRQPSTDARRAIWEAWDKRSAYTSEPVLWSQLHIDHIIPIAKADIIENLQQKKLIPSDFDINGFGNLIPAANHQNQRKSASEMGESALIYFLDLARSKKDDIEKRISRILRSNSEVKLYLSIKAASEINDVSLDEMIRVYDHQFGGNVTLRISPQIEGAQIAVANSMIAATLMDKPFSLGGGSIGEVILQSSNGHSIICRTSNEFIHAVDLGYFAATQTDIKIASMASETTEALRAIRDSSFAEESDLREPIVKFKHFHRWAAEWVTEGLIDSNDAEAASALRTIDDLLNAGICEVERIDEHEVRFRVPAGLDVMMRESMRADLDGDRWEEVLVFHYMSARDGGSFGVGQAVMAKVAEDGLLRMRPYPPNSSEDWTK